MNDDDFYEIKDLKLTIKSLLERVDAIETGIRSLPIRGQLGGYSVIRRAEVMEILAGKTKENDE